jgi:hypothetical protein
MQLRHYYSPKCRNDVEANRRWKATLRRSSHRGRARLHPLFGGALLATPSADRTLNHPSTTTLRRSCKQLPSRFPPIARWLLRRSVALHRQAGCLCYLAVATHRTRSPIFSRPLACFAGLDHRPPTTPRFRTLSGSAKSLAALED